MRFSEGLSRLEIKKSNNFREWILLIGHGQQNSSLMNVVGVAGLPSVILKWG
jgi:hypothetical protein